MTVERLDERLELMEVRLARVEEGLRKAQRPIKVLRLLVAGAEHLRLAGERVGRGLQQIVGAVATAAAALLRPGAPDRETSSSGTTQ
jgi:hypothetical protein